MQIHPLPQLLEERSIFQSNDKRHFLGARGMHYEKYCDPAKLSDDAQIIDLAAQEIAARWLSATISAVVPIANCDEALAKAVARRSCELGACAAFVGKPEVREGELLYVAGFVDEANGIRAYCRRVARMPKVSGVNLASVVATPSVNAVLLGTSRFTTCYALDGQKWDTWGCGKTGPCSRGVPAV